MSERAVKRTTEVGAAEAAEALIIERIEASIAVKRALAPLVPEIARAADLMTDAFRQGGKAIFFGNGGSAADAQHLAGELESRFRFDRPPLPALALHANTSTLTAIGNDMGYDEVFARLLRAHARPEDVAVAISTSGTSPNVLAAAAVRAEVPFRLIALVGQNGAPLGAHADVVLAVPSQVTPRVQEAHILIGHILCELVEQRIFGQAP
jgi:D-sedoheptulose 7-phosphate isomerase